MTRIGIPKEIHPGEKRVAATPQTILKLKKLGFEVAVESHAGHGINSIDSEYREAGAEIIDDTKDLWATSDVIMKVRPPEPEEVGLLREGGGSSDSLARTKPRDRRWLAKKNATVSRDSVRDYSGPKMDTLSRGNIAGIQGNYRGGE